MQRQVFISSNSTVYLPVLLPDPECNKQETLPVYQNLGDELTNVIDKCNDINKKLTKRERSFCSCRIIEYELTNLDHNYPPENNTESQQLIVFIGEILIYI